MNWKAKRVLVTGATSFMGSSLLEAIVSREAIVRLSTGRDEHVSRLVESGTVEFIKGSLLDAAIATRSVQGIDHLFHLAAIHGGRGYVDLPNAECAMNLVLERERFSRRNH